MQKRMNQLCIVFPLVSLWNCFLTFFLTNTVSVLNPKFKLQYFKNENWPQEWIDTAVEVLRDHWNLYYKPNESAMISASQESVRHLSFDLLILFLTVFLIAKWQHIG